MCWHKWTGKTPPIVWWLLTPQLDKPTVGKQRLKISCVHHGGYWKLTITHLTTHLQLRLPISRTFSSPPPRPPHRLIQRGGLLLPICQLLPVSIFFKPRISITDEKLSFKAGESRWKWNLSFFPEKKFQLPPGVRTIKDCLALSLPMFKFGLHSRMKNLIIFNIMHITITYHNVSRSFVP